MSSSSLPHLFIFGLGYCGQTLAHRARVTPQTGQVMKITTIERQGSSDASGFLPPVT